MSGVDYDTSSGQSRLGDKMEYTFGRDEARPLPNLPMKPGQQQTGIKGKVGGTYGGTNW